MDEHLPAPRTPADDDPPRPCLRHHKWMPACDDCQAWHRHLDRLRQEAGGL